jgi:dTDP-glucose 4,6-dehydratase
MNKTVLVTGGMGFIGSNFILYLLDKYPVYRIYNLDKLTYAGNPDHLAKVQSLPNYFFIHGDIADQALVDRVMGEGIDTVVHIAAETHVDRSIENPHQFVLTNVVGTQVLLESARLHRVSKFVHISTDEVYGTLGATGRFTEHTPLAPNSPYSSSKAASDLLARAYHKTYGLNVSITRCSNNYGPRQNPEKLIPLIITHALQDQPIPIYGDGLNVRDWLYVEDHCRAIDLVMHKGMAGEVYNIGGRNEYTNLEVASMILDELGKPKSLLQFVRDRPGHDRRYAIDAAKITKELGWTPACTFRRGIGQTLRWYLEQSESRRR